MPPWLPIITVLLTVGGTLVGIGMGWGVMQSASRRQEDVAKRLEVLVPDVARLDERIKAVDTRTTERLAGLEGRVQRLESFARA